MYLRLEDAHEVCRKRPNLKPKNEYLKCILVTITITRLNLVPSLYYRTALIKNVKQHRFCVHASHTQSSVTRLISYREK
jgi:hypothetical protein